MHYNITLNIAKYALKICNKNNKIWKEKRKLTFNDVAKDGNFARNLSIDTDKIEKFDFMYAKLFSRLGLSEHFFFNMYNIF